MSESLIQWSFLTGVALICVFASVVSSPAIGNYPNLHPEHCGVNMHSSDNEMCYRWNTDYIGGQTQKRIKREYPKSDYSFAMARQMPWMFRVKVRFVSKEKNYTDPADGIVKNHTLEGFCVGTLIGDKYVLTAAPCVKWFFNDDKNKCFGCTGKINSIETGVYDWLKRFNDGDIKVHPKYLEGYNKYKDRIPERISSDQMSWEEKDYRLYGLALIRTRDTEIHQWPGEVKIVKKKINSICLPNKTVNIGNNEYVMDARLNDENKDVDRYRISTRKTVDNPLMAEINDTKTRELYRKLTFAEKSFKEGSYDCRSGIGAPVWQYLKGRAVLMGIRIDYVPPGYKWRGGFRECGYKQNSVGIVIKITEFIDWLNENVN